MCNVSFGIIEFLLTRGLRLESRWQLVADPVCLNFFALPPLVARIRVPGEVIQAIFGEVNKENSLEWSLVTEKFNTIAELHTPWRWKNENAELGEWLSTVRAKILDGDNIDLRTGPIKLVSFKSYGISKFLF